MCKRIIFLHHGRVIATGTSDRNHAGDPQGGTRGTRARGGLPARGEGQGRMKTHRINAVMLRHLRSAPQRRSRHRPGLLAGSRHHRVGLFHDLPGAQQPAAAGYRELPARRGHPVGSVLRLSARHGGRLHRRAMVAQSDQPVLDAAHRVGIHDRTDRGEPGEGDGRDCAASLIAWAAYSFNIFPLLPIFIPYIANLVFFALALGIAITGLIFRYTTQIQALAWSFAGLLQPVSCVFYPISSLPRWLRAVAWMLPTAHSFEGMRQVLAGNGFSPVHFWWGVGLERDLLRARDGSLPLDFRVGADARPAGQAGLAPIRTARFAHPPLSAHIICTSSVARSSCARSYTCSRLTKNRICRRMRLCSSIMRKRIPGKVLEID